MFKTSLNAMKDGGTEGARGNYLIRGETSKSRSGLVGYGALGANGSVPVHRHVNAEEAIVVLEGGGELLTSRGPVSLSPGSLVYSRPSAWHGIRTSGQPLRVLTIVPGYGDPDEVAYEEQTETPTDPGPEASVLRLDDSEQVQVHDPQRGFYHFTARFGLDGDSVGTKDFMVMESSSAAGKGHHVLHRHPAADEFAYIAEGEGVYITESGEVPLAAGDLYLTPAGEWHGFRNTGTEPGRSIFGFFGASSLEKAGYELHDSQAAGR